MNQLIKKVIEHEGFRRHVYRDTKGYYTVGIGRNIDPKCGGGISRNEAITLLQNDLLKCRKTLEHHVWFRHLNVVRQEVLIELMFNCGARGFYSFKKMRAALMANDFIKAEKELLDSKWRSDVGEKRASDMAYRLRHGEYL